MDQKSPGTSIDCDFSIDRKLSTYLLPLVSTRTMRVGIIRELERNDVVKGKALPLSLSFSFSFFLYYISFFS